MELVAGALLRQLHSERTSGLTPPGRQLSVSQICSAVAQCRISPEAPANACAVNLGGWSHSAAYYDQLDRGLALSLGEDFAAAFVESISNVENYFRQKGIFVY
jgi:hypothetical protein